MNNNDLDLAISKEKLPIILDFWASWCVPCHITKPILEKLSAEFSGKVRFIAVNADDSREFLEKFNVYGIPTVIALKDGVETNRITGGQSEKAYRAFFSSISSGMEFKPGLSIFDRFLRLGSGIALFAFGAMEGNGWILVAGGFITFFGLYDRCPIWNALMKKLYR